jgi:hypothetical protein
VEVEVEVDSATAAEIGSVTRSASATGETTEGATTVATTSVMTSATRGVSTPTTGTRERVKEGVPVQDAAS